MKATVVDLRYKMRDILKALDKNEDVDVYYHGKKKAILSPVKNDIKKVKDHPFFGMQKDAGISVEEEMKQLRKTRYHDL